MYNCYVVVQEREKEAEKVLEAEPARSILSAWCFHLQENISAVCHHYATSFGK